MDLIGDMSLVFEGPDPMDPPQPSPGSPGTGGGGVAAATDTWVRSATPDGKRFWFDPATGATTFADPAAAISGHDAGPGALPDQPSNNPATGATTFADPAAAAWDTGAGGMADQPSKEAREVVSRPNPQPLSRVAVDPLAAFIALSSPCVVQPGLAAWSCGRHINHSSCLAQLGWWNGVHLVCCSDRVSVDQGARCAAPTK